MARESEGRTEGKREDGREGKTVPEGTAHVKSQST